MAKHDLRSLELSLSSSKAQRARSQSTVVEGGSAMRMSEVNEHVNIVRGRKLATPSRGLRMLESRVLGQDRPHRSPPQCIEHRNMRTDQGQVSQEVAQPFPPQAPIAPSAPVTAPVASPAFSAAAGIVPFMSRFDSAPRYRNENALSPEFSAPNTGRFHVESFEEEINPVLENAPVMRAPQAPVIDAVPTPEAVAPTPNMQAPMLNPQVRKPAIAEDEEWLSPEDKPTVRSQSALTDSIALAKNEFEKDLESILGSKPAAQPAPENDQLTPPTGQAQPQQTQNNAQQEEEAQHSTHQSHDIFDQMGLGMGYANSFDLGKVNLNDRFDQFERELAISPNADMQAQSMAAPKMLRQADLPDEFDLVADLAEISGANRPPMHRPAQMPPVEDETQAEMDVRTHAPQTAKPKPIIEQNQTEQAPGNQQENQIEQQEQELNEIINKATNEQQQDIQAAPNTTPE